MRELCEFSVIYQNNQKGQIHMYSIKYPLKLQPADKDYLWGGNKMKQLYNKQNNMTVTAESWELSCHPDGKSRIANGAYANQLLADVLQQHPEYVAHNFTAQQTFPILIKLIDAEQDLSVQVHPSDDTADRASGEQGKAEMWYVIHCEPQSYIYYGLNQEVSQERLIRRAEDGSICKVLNKVPVHQGDIFFIHPGTIHALGKGIIIAEIQQNSNTTFRVFDYCRKDSHGNQRPLHIDRAAQVINYQPMVPDQAGENNQMHTNAYDYAQIFTCEYFKVARVRCRSEISLHCDKKSFHAIVVIRGNGTLYYSDDAYPLKAGDSYYIPANAGVYRIIVDEPMEFLLSMI